MTACPLMLASFFDEPLWQAAFANGLAVILGIPAGLFLQKWISWQTSKPQQCKMREALKRSLNHNQGTLTTIKEMLQNRGSPTFSLDLTLLDATAYSKYDVLGDIDLCAGIDHLRFELDHLGRQVDALLRLELDRWSREPFLLANGQQGTIYTQFHPQLVKSIQDRLPPLAKECEELLQKLNKSPRSLLAWLSRSHATIS